MLRKFHLGKLLWNDDHDALRRDLGEIKTDPVDLLAELGIAKEEITLWGTGAAMREFLYVDDLADACLFMMNGPDAPEIGEIVNVGTGIDLSICDLAEKIRSIVGYEGAIAWDPAKPDGTPRKLLEISRIRALGWKPKTDLDDGIRRTYEHYLQNGWTPRHND